MPAGVPRDDAAVTAAASAWPPPRACPAPQNEKVLLIVNEPNQNVYLSGRNVPTLAINTSHAVQVGA